MKKSVVLESSVVLALACSLAACASKDGDGEVTGPAGPGGPGDPPAELECDPNGAIPCIEGIAEPCKDFNSGFEGDEYCLEPPDPSVGLQARVGPADYDDPTVTEKYMIYPGEETNWAEVVVSQNTETLYTRGYRSHMRPGSHHFIMFSVKDAVASGPMENAAGTESAVGAVGGVFLGGATKAIQNVDTKGEFPEDQGIGTELIPQRPVAFNLHFVNTTDQPLLQEIWVNFILIPEAEVTQYVKPITWYGGLGMNIQPGVHTTLKNAPNSCTAPADLRLAMMTAHAHANTLRVTTTMNDSTLLFEDYDWHEPTEWRYNRSAQNPAPDAALKKSGGHSGILEVAPGDQFSWECEVENKTTSNLTFGNKVYTGEMCNVFGFYFTPDKAATPWMCAFF